MRCVRLLRCVSLRHVGTHARRTESLTRKGRTRAQRIRSAPAPIEKGTDEAAEVERKKIGRLRGERRSTPRKKSIVGLLG